VTVLLVAGEMAEDREQGVEEFFDTPEQPVHGQVRGEHAARRSESRESPPHPRLDRLPGRPEQQGEPLQLQRDVREPTDGLEPVGPSLEALGGQVQGPPDRLEHDRRLLKLPEQLVRLGDLLVVDEQIPGQALLGNPFETPQPSGVAQEVRTCAEPAQRICGPVQRLADSADHR